MNDDILNLSTKVIKDMLELDSTTNVEYSDEIVVYHLHNVCKSSTHVNQVSDVCVYNPSEGTILHRLRKLDLGKINRF